MQGPALFECTECKLKLCALCHSDHPKSHSIKDYSKEALKIYGLVKEKLGNLEVQVKKQDEEKADIEKAVKKITQYMKELEENILDSINIYYESTSKDAEMNKVTEKKLKGFGVLVDQMEKLISDAKFSEVILLQSNPLMSKIAALPVPEIEEHKISTGIGGIQKRFVKSLRNLIAEIEQQGEFGEDVGASLFEYQQPENNEISKKEAKKEVLIKDKKCIKCLNTFSEEGNIFKICKSNHSLCRKCFDQ